MKIALSSQSGVKVDAVNKSFGHIEGLDLVAIKAPSSVNEQPIGDETLCGSFNRLAFIEGQCPDADIYVSIENGLFEEDGDYVDRAVVILKVKGHEPVVAMSDGVTFPKEYVEFARMRGFKTTTVGQVMEEAKYVEAHNDPHKSITGTPRAAYIDDALARAKVAYQKRDNLTL